jgi:Fe-Mn family superoxide dismutase
MAEARESGNFGTLPKLQKDLAFNLGGHVNHSVFWQNLSPNGGEAQGELLAAITEYFGSFDAFKAHFTAAAIGIQGSGWAYLAWDAMGNRMVIGQLYDQQGNIALGSVPLLMLDMWEHAFYLDYQNVKADYVKAFWNIINWEDVAKRFASVKVASRSLLLG